MALYTDESGKEWEYDCIEEVLDHIYEEFEEFELMPSKLGFIQVLSEDQVEIGTIS